MGIKIFYILAILYAILSGVGILNRELGAPYIYLFLFIVTAYYMAYISLKKIQFFYTIVAGMALNLMVQLTGGLLSPLFLFYLFCLH